jgi:hypothetical protein
MGDVQAGSTVEALVGGCVDVAWMIITMGWVQGWAPIEIAMSESDGHSSVAIDKNTEHCLRTSS